MSQHDEDYAEKRDSKSLRSNIGENLALWLEKERKWQEKYQETLNALNRANSVNCVLERERDEARAEVERLTNKLNADSQHFELECRKAQIERLTEQQDELLALLRPFVESLFALLERYKG